MLQTLPDNPATANKVEILKIIEAMVGVEYAGPPSSADVNKFLRVLTNSAQLE